MSLRALLRSALRSLSRPTVVVIGLLSGSGLLCAQPAFAPMNTFEQQVGKVSNDMQAWPQLKGLTPDQRRETVIFVLGNMLFGVFHEMGHAVISEMQLPVLGREEDAADSFAILAGTKMMTNISERALIEAGKGWFFNDLNDKKNGYMQAFYESHGMNLQRAYQIVCFMVGADPVKFRHIAEVTKLPESRQKSCGEDYAIAVWSWETLLEPHRRKPDQPPTKIDVVYSEAKGDLDVYAKSFKDLQFLERLAHMASSAFVWRGPFKLEMETCGFVNAFWNVKNRKLQICYELVDSYVDLYREFMTNPAIQKRMEALKPPAAMR
jgi:hypothetical protein